VKFFLDHDVPAEVGRVLRQVGHEVIELRQVLPPHTCDFEALELRTSARARRMTQELLRVINLKNLRHVASNAS
jgi:hypothetical protein